MTLLDKYFNGILKIYPSFATRLGDKESECSYEDITTSEFINNNEKLIIKLSDKIIKESSKSKSSKSSKSKSSKSSESIDSEILLYIINMYIKRPKYYFSTIPINSFSNPIIDFTFINDTIYSIKSSNDTKNLIYRHDIFINRINYYIHQLMNGIKRHITMPKIICESLIKSLEYFCDNKKYIVDINTKNKQEYIDYANNVYVLNIIKLINFLKHTYLHKCRESIGLCHLHNGKKIYQYFLDIMLTFKMKPEKIHKLGIQEVSRLSSLIDKVKNELGYSNVTLKEFNKIMINDKKNYYNSTEETLTAFKKEQEYINKHVMPLNFFKNVSDYDIKSIPSYMEKNNALAFYYPGTVFNDTRKSIVFINTRSSKENPKYSTLSLIAHEGSPGHHYHFQHMKDTNVRISRQYAIHNTTLIEGWALYSESLVDYSNRQYEYFGKLNNELLRAVRLVVDTGVHYYGWSFNKAINYMSEHLAVSITEIETELKRYICMPGQAVCYKIGELEILKLRRKFLNKFSKKYDEQFLIKTFHDILLSDGIIPFDVIKNKIHSIIKYGCL
jgi:uncharacterized protein (DUF885 family)